MKKSRDGGPRPCQDLDTRNTSSKRLSRSLCDSDILKCVLFCYNVIILLLSVEYHELNPELHVLMKVKIGG